MFCHYFQKSNATLNLGNKTTFYFSNMLLQLLPLYPNTIKMFFVLYEMKVSYVRSHFLQNPNTVLNEKREISKKYFVLK
jgi:hypothetical protein